MGSPTSKLLIFSQSLLLNILDLISYEFLQRKVSLGRNPCVNLENDVIGKILSISLIIPILNVSTSFQRQFRYINNLLIHFLVEKIVLKGKNSNNEYDIPGDYLAPKDDTKQQLHMVEMMLQKTTSFVPFTRKKEVKQEDSSTSNTPKRTVQRLFPPKPSTPPLRTVKTEPKRLSDGVINLDSDEDEEKLPKRQKTHEVKESPSAPRSSNSTNATMEKWLKKPSTSSASPSFRQKSPVNKSLAASPKPSPSPSSSKTPTSSRPDTSKLAQKANAVPSRPKSPVNKINTSSYQSSSSKTPTTSRPDTSKLGQKPKVVPAAPRLVANDLSGVERKIEDYIDVVYPKGQAIKKFEASEPYNFFLTAIVDSPPTHKEQLSITMQEILDTSLGDLESSVQINFMVDVGWLLAHYYFAGHE